MIEETPPISDNDIAIVGMAVNLPGASNLSQYWENLRDGVETISKLNRSDLLEAGEELSRINHKDYVASAAKLDGYKMFDADFFGLSPKEAAIMDPQHRKFLETSWEALETAGHPPENFDGRIGVFAGSGMGSYFYFNVCSNPDLVDKTGMFLLRHTGNDKDFMATRLSHILDLKGPSINLQTACSTSLVATHYACQSLLNGECDMALAGGSTIELPHGRGYIYEEGEILSPDGHCHAFDHRAKGTVFGSGAGVVVLRRLADAIADGDHIWGVIKGSAVNNDGSAKAGYLAPSVDGQATAISEAQAVANTPAGTIDYVECHGTGTYLGDPIEVAALTEAFRHTTDKTGYCHIGSVKTNIGHLDTAAGVASLVKTTLSLHNQQIPPSLGYEKPNPAIDFEASPFKVNAKLQDWASNSSPRRAGVNSMGVGGTNAHVVVEEAPKQAPYEASDWPFHILTVSGRSKSALNANAKALAAHLRAHPEQELADISFTLKEGRRHFEHQRILVANSHEQAAELLETNDPQHVFTHKSIAGKAEVTFMFPGGGAQFVGMGQGLYETEPVFQEWVDRGFDILQPELDLDIRALWLPEDDVVGDAEERLKQPSIQLPLIMIIEYALAKLWMSWGVRPTALVGHSMGENTAACLAGVLSFKDCIKLIHLRGQLFDTVPAGGMMCIRLPVGDVRNMLGDNLDLASVNAPELSVVSGPDAALAQLQDQLAEHSIDFKRIPIDIAAHSRMLDPILEKFRGYLQTITLNPPELPIVSNSTGTFLTDDEATNPEYWVNHLRGTIMFADCITTLATEPNRIYLEVGPGKALSSMAAMNDKINHLHTFSTLRHPDQDIADDVYFVSVLARLWATGVNIDWEQIWGSARRNRVVLPTYAFQQSEYFIERQKTITQSVSNDLLTRTEDIADWGYRPVWHPRLADCVFDVEADLALTDKQTWLFFIDKIGVGSSIAKNLRMAGHNVIEVHTGDDFIRESDSVYLLAPERGREGYDALIKDLVSRDIIPNHIVNFWLLTQDEQSRPGSSFFHQNQEQGFNSLVSLAQAISDENLTAPLHITAITSGAAQVKDEELPYPEKAMILGPIRGIPHEFPNVTCSALDVDINARLKSSPTHSLWKRRRVQNKASAIKGLTKQILEELLAPTQNTIAALRGDKRFELGFHALKLPEPQNDNVPVYQPNNAYLITGGFGGIGLTFAKDILKHQATVILLTRMALPDRTGWKQYLLSHSPNDKTAKRILAVQQLEALGGQVEIAVGDVCNITDMSTIIDAAQNKFGPIKGVIHAAGIIDDGPLLTKNMATMDTVLAPKIHGTQVLHKLFPDGALDWLVLFSSTSTVIAAAGQVDYMSANEYLNAYAKSRKTDHTQVISINWGIWKTVGMSADAIAERLGAYDKPPVNKIKSPLLDRATFDANGNRVFTADFTVNERWVLDEHRTISGKAVMPGTGYIELAIEALRANGENAAFEMHDLLFSRPLQMENTERRTIQITLTRTATGYSFEARSDCVHDGRKGFQLHAQANLILTGTPKPTELNIKDIYARCGEKQRPDQGAQTIRTAQEIHLNFGPRWRVLRNLAYGTNEGIAELRLSLESRQDIKQGYMLHPALVDIATGWAMKLIEGYQAEHLWVPVSYDTIRIYKNLPDQVFSWVRNSENNNIDTQFASFDVTIFDAKGHVCIEVNGFTIKQLSDAQALTNTPALAHSEVVFASAQSEIPHPLSAAEERLHSNFTQAISPTKGVAAFHRAFQTGQPQVFVSSLDLDALVAQEDGPSVQPEDTEQTFARPDLDTEYVAPSNDIERTLVGFWESLLGVQNVSVTDSFFDLGGHSLIAVRLFSMVKKAYQIEFPISILFEAPTIEKYAALIANQTGYLELDQEGTKPLEPTEDTQQYTHLVAMHDGETGDKTPFFIVAGMFGNVLNLRHLAHLVGHDRPFYGLQARGLFGDSEPHNSLYETAADYIAEMRVVQPKGPYLLGGFSGGGVTAYEIAQQLEAAGETVSLLALLDTPLPQRRPLSVTDRAIIQWNNLKEKGLLHVLQWPINRVKWELSKRRPTIGNSDNDTQFQFNNAGIEAAFLHAIKTYTMKPWGGAVTLFRPPLIGKWHVSNGQLVNSERAYVLHDNDWGQWVDNMTVIEVPGDHDSIVLEPNVRVLATHIKTCIDAVEKTSATNNTLPYDGIYIEAAE